MRAVHSHSENQRFHNLSCLTQSVFADSYGSHGIPVAAVANLILPRVKNHVQVDNSNQIKYKANGHALNCACPTCAKELADYYDRLIASTTEVIMPAPPRNPKPVIDEKRISKSSSSDSIKQFSVSSDNSIKKRHGVLYFGGIVKKDSLIGACAWWVADENKRVVTYGSIHVVQSFPSLVFVEYEGLLNGLKAANHHNFTTLTIIGCSSLILAQLSPYFEQKTQLFRAIITETKEPKQAVQLFLNKFEYYDTEIIPTENNHYVYQLAEKAIAKYDRRKYLAMTNLFKTK